MPSNEVPKVFLDANVVIEAGWPPRNLYFVRLNDLVKAGLINILTTDVTVMEITKKHTENDYNSISKVTDYKFRNRVEMILGSKLPDITEDELRAKIFKINQLKVESMFERLTARTLPVDDVKPSIVLSAYAVGKGLFESTNKKNQFPDAFIFECIKADASKEEPVIIVSGDDDFTSSVRDENYISLVKSLPELFKKLELQVDEPEIGNFLRDKMDLLNTKIRRELADWKLIGDIEGSKLWVADVVDVEFKELTCFGSIEKGGPILVVGRLSVKTNVIYSHPDWMIATYSSEEMRPSSKNYIRGEITVSLSVDLSMFISIDEDGSLTKIEDLQFRDNKFQNVELYPGRFFYR